MLEDSLTEIRTFLGSFRPPEFAKRDVLSVLEGGIIQFEAITGNRVEFQIEGEIPVVYLPVKIALSRILPEASWNSYRHSGGNDQCVRLWTKGESLGLRVSGQGMGFDAGPLDGPAGTERVEHIGLRGMRDRVASVGGPFALSSRPGKGTRITVEMPVYG